MKIKIHLFLIMAFFSVAAHAQSYIGHTVDNYSGVHGILLNPASVVDSNFRTDINLFSGSAFLGSDYFGIDLNSAFGSTEGFSFNNPIQKSPKNDNQFFLNVDVLGPSFMFNLNPQSSLAITSRARGFLNFNNVHGELYEGVRDRFEGFNEDENFNFELNNFTGTIHSWSELGITYGRILMDGGFNFIKGGVTLKYLSGSGSAFFMAPAVTGSYVAETELITTTGNLSYGSSPGFNGRDIVFGNLSSGFGADLGLTYEYRPEARFTNDPGTRIPNNYKFKLGASVTDIGSLSYSGSRVTTFDLNSSIHQDRFEEEYYMTVLEEEYESTERVMDAKISLPTAMHLLVDYKFRNHLFVAVQGSLSLIGEGSAQANRIINSITAVPRFESKWLSFYLPVGIRQYDGFTMGVGLRFGPLSLGSGSVISNYVTGAARTADVYAGLKIPIYR